MASTGVGAACTERREACAVARHAIPKEPLAREIRRLVMEKELSQAKAAALVGDAASELSLLLSGEFRGFSVDRVVRTLLRLGREVEIVVRPAGGRRAKHATVRIVSASRRRVS